MIYVLYSNTDYEQKRKESVFFFIKTRDNSFPSYPLSPPPPPPLSSIELEQYLLQIYLFHLHIFKMRDRKLGRAHAKFPRNKLSKQINLSLLLVSFQEVLPFDLVKQNLFPSFCSNKSNKGGKYGR